MLESAGWDADTDHGDGDVAAPVSSKSETVAAEQALRDQIGALLPRLTRYARVLTRDVVAADDLVQDCVARALAKIHLWEPGTDLRAWLFAILHSQHVNGLRRDARHRASIDMLKAQRASALLPNQHDRVELREVECALAKLPENQRSLILLVGLEGMGYEDAASAVKIPLGTVRSRIGRGRETLRCLTERAPAADMPKPERAAGSRHPRRKPFCRTPVRSGGRPGALLAAE